MANPADTATINDFILAGDDVNVTYHKTSILAKSGDIEYPIYNILDDYMAELKAAMVVLSLSDKEFNKYQYNPKLLAYDLYGQTDLFFLLMKLNNICDPKEFNFKKVNVLRKTDLSIINRIINAEKKSIENNRDSIET